VEYLSPFTHSSVVYKRVSHKSINSSARLLETNDVPELVFKYSSSDDQRESTGVIQVPSPPSCQDQVPMHTSLSRPPTCPVSSVLGRQHERNAMAAISQLSIYRAALSSASFASHSRQVPWCCKHACSRLGATPMLEGVICGYNLVHQAMSRSSHADLPSFRTP
jgi:hypothetical protein